MAKNEFRIYDFLELLRTKWKSILIIILSFYIISNLLYFFIPLRTFGEVQFDFKYKDIFTLLDESIEITEEVKSEFTTMVNINSFSNFLKNQSHVKKEISLDIIINGSKLDMQASGGNDDILTITNNFNKYAGDYLTFQFQSYILDELIIETKQNLANELTKQKNHIYIFNRLNELNGTEFYSDQFDGYQFDELDNKLNENQYDRLIEIIIINLMVEKYESALKEQIKLQSLDFEAYLLINQQSGSIFDEFKLTKNDLSEEKLLDKTSFNIMFTCLGLLLSILRLLILNNISIKKNTNVHVTL